MALLNRRGLWFALILLTLIAFALFFIPAFIIRPFRYQAPDALRLAIAVKYIAPALTIAALLGAIAASSYLWRSASIFLRVCISFALLLSVTSAVMVRQNYFEWMFNPIKTAGFIPANDAKLNDKEMVMTVKIGGDSRAYPIVQMAYHHILNDTVSGEPIVVTY
jgi:hypothetical protein